MGTNGRQISVWGYLPRTRSRDPSTPGLVSPREGASHTHRTPMATIFPSPAPELPQFHTLVLCGPYHPSAPIYLMLSHNWRDPRGKAIFISPSRSTFLDNLAKFDDEWLRLHGGDGRTMGASARIEN